MPEEFFVTTSDAMARFGGRVMQRQGDSVLACFGWPEAHENDTERAVRAGMAVVGQGRCGAKRISA